MKIASFRSSFIAVNVLAMRGEGILAIGKSHQEEVEAELIQHCQNPSSSAAHGAPSVKPAKNRNAPIRSLNTDQPISREGSEGFGEMEPASGAQ